MTKATVRAARQPVLGLPDPGEKVPPLAWPQWAYFTEDAAISESQRPGL